GAPSGATGSAHWSTRAYASTATSGTRTSRPRPSTPGSSCAGSWGDGNPRESPYSRPVVKVVIFCGGRGMRLESSSDSQRLPKPMASIGGRPLLWHIMSYYAHFGHQRFALCLGYRGGAIRDYFSKSEFSRLGWEIEFVETGLDASIGERFAAAREVIDEDAFGPPYGDPLTDADLPSLIRTRAESGQLASLLAVPPNYTFNVVASDDDDVVTGFHDVADSPLWINGGFFVFDRRVF